MSLSLRRTGLAHSCSGDRTRATVHFRPTLAATILADDCDVDEAAEHEICLKYTSADDQVAYLMSKTVRLAEYLKIGMLGIVATIHRQHDKRAAKQPPRYQRVR
jgi:hypothetical protein